MLKVKIINGQAVEIEHLKTQGGFMSFCKRLFVPAFQIINDHNNKVPFEEGNIYWAWSVGNGKIVLLEIISSSELSED
jgi:hypothetical protein